MVLLSDQVALKGKLDTLAASSEGQLAMDGSIQSDGVSPNSNPSPKMLFSLLAVLPDASTAKSVQGMGSRPFHTQ